MTATGNSAVGFTFGIAHAVVPRPLAAAAAAVGLVVVNGRAALIDLLIAAFSAAADENWRVSAFKRSWRLVDVLTGVLAACRVWNSVIDEAGIVFSCVAANVAFLHFWGGC